MRSTTRFPGALQLDLYAAVKRLMIDRMVWFIRNVDLEQGLMAIVDHYKAGIKAVARALEAAPDDEATIARDGRVNEMTRSGVPERLAKRIASLPALTVAPDIVLVADKTGRDITEVARTFLAVVRYFRLERVVDAARQIEATDYFDRLALDRSRDLLARAARQLTAEVLKGGAGTEAMDELGQAARDRGRTHPHLDARDRRYRADAVEAVGGGKSAGRSGGAVS